MNNEQRNFMAARWEVARDLLRTMPLISDLVLHGDMSEAELASLASVLFELANECLGTALRAAKARRRLARQSRNTQ